MESADLVLCQFQAHWGQSYFFSALFRSVIFGGQCLPLKELLKWRLSHIPAPESACPREGGSCGGRFWKQGGLGLFGNWCCYSGIWYLIIRFCTWWDTAKWCQCLRPGDSWFEAGILCRPVWLQSQHGLLPSETTWSFSVGASPIDTSGPGMRWAACISAPLPDLTLS